MTAPRVLPPINERQWMRQVVELAKTFRWAVYHTQLSKWSEAGWPDLALCRPPRLILAELKSATGKLTDGQRGWIELLEACPGIEVCVWRPADLETVAATLR